MKYSGRTTIEVEGNTPLSPASLERLADRLRLFLARSSEDHAQVHAITVTTQHAARTMTVQMVLEADGAEELDEVADFVLDRALVLLAEPAAGEELIVLESALVPA